MNRSIGTTLFCGLLSTSFLSSIANGSGISYSYLKLNASFDWYTGSNYGDVSLNVHELQLNDSSGALSASLETMSNRVSAEAEAENKERLKVEKGESIGGPKSIQYAWKEAIAVDGDTKIYGLRVASSDNPFSLDPFSNDKSKDGLVTYVELSMVAAISQNILLESVDLIATGTWFWGGRFGGINSNDFSRKENNERTLDAAYLYLPLTYQVKMTSSIGVETWIGGGGDIVTLIRNLGSKADRKIPLDLVYTGGLGYRLPSEFNFGLKVEQYSGSLISGWGKKYEYVNPKYKHTLVGGYLAYGF